MSQLLQSHSLLGVKVAQAPQQLADDLLLMLQAGQEPGQELHGLVLLQLAGSGQLSLQGAQKRVLSA